MRLTIRLYVYAFMMIFLVICCANKVLYEITFANLRDIYILVSSLARGGAVW